MNVKITFNKHVVFDSQNLSTNHFKSTSNTSISSLMMEGRA